MSESLPHVTSASQPAPRAAVPLRPIIIFVLALAGLTGLVLLGMSWLFTSVTSRQARQDAAPAPMAQTASPLPPEPRLQVKPAHDLRQLRAAEDAILHSYGWVDRSTGTVRIPIERALALLVARGLPSRTEAQSGSNAESKGAP